MRPRRPAAPGGALAVLSLVSFFVVPALAHAVGGGDVGAGGAVDVTVRLPFCETRRHPTGEYRTEWEVVREPFTTYKETTIPGRWTTRTVKELYTAYRPRTELVEKVLSVTRTVLTPVVTMVQRVRTWFERTRLGQLIKRATSRLEPVQRWVQKTIIQPVVERVRMTVLEPHTAYREVTVPLYVPPTRVTIPVLGYRDVTKPRRVPETIEVKAVIWRDVALPISGIPVWILEELFRTLPPCEPLETNLCGQLVVLAAVGDDVPQGLTRSKEPSWGGISGQSILQANATTGAGDLSGFLHATYGWVADYAYGSLRREDLTGELRDGNAVIGLVTLNTWNARLEPGSGDAFVGHWVLILELLDTRQGGEVVRVYNPFMNREEYYTWGRIGEAWRGLRVRGRRE